MLIELEIKNFALIEHLKCPFTRGLNILTGETGAGKSIIIDALNAALGSKTNPGVIRFPAEKAVVEATFTISCELKPWLTQHELCDEDSDSLVVSREITKSSSKLRINGILVNSSLIQELRALLLTLHAQNETRTLLSPQSQLEMLDGMGDPDHQQLLAQVKSVYTQQKDLENKLNELIVSEEEQSRRLDYAKFQQSELEGAHLTEEDEDEKVTSQCRLLSNVQELAAMANRVEEVFQGNDFAAEGAGILDLLQTALSHLNKAKEVDGKLSELWQEVSSSLETLENSLRKLRRYRESLQLDPEALAVLQERQTQLAAIKRKYGPTLRDAILRKAELVVEIDQLEQLQSTIASLTVKLSQTKNSLKQTAEKLSEKRKSLALGLAQNIQIELTHLGMNHCQFEIAFSQNANILSYGFDQIEFLIAPNPGHPLLAVSKIASGGELSRIMLAIKSIFAKSDKIATVVFDEIDTGLSGKVLAIMRDKMARLAASHQILLITHQPLIASAADNHIHVTKEQSQQATHVQLSVLNKQDRLQALANMASGEKDQEAALKFAKALYEESTRAKAQCL